MGVYSTVTVCVIHLCGASVPVSFIGEGVSGDGRGTCSYRSLKMLRLMVFVVGDREVSAVGKAFLRDPLVSIFVCEGAFSRGKNLCDLVFVIKEVRDRSQAYVRGRVSRVSERQA